MTIKFNQAVEIAKELAKAHGRIMAVFEHGGDYEVVCVNTYETIFAHHNLSRVATVAPSGRIIQ